MTASFPDHFSSGAANYARYRPTYPEALFEWIATEAPARNTAWDCGCGNGQASLPLAERFERVLATDPSEEQIRMAPVHPRIQWSVATAEASDLAAAVADAVTVAQALHWFDLPRFWVEVRRVVRPGGLVAVWTYGRPFLGDAALSDKLMQLHDGVVGPYWPKERGYVNEGYHSIDFPFERIAAPEFDMRMRWSLDDLAGYLGTWSATRRYIAANGSDPVPPFIASIASLWGNGSRDVCWPLTVLAGRVAAPVAGT